MQVTEIRKIVHIDMDAFYASVEQRDNPDLRGLPVVVGGSPYSRGVVAASSYEARQFGIRSAMPSRQALALCPGTVFVSPRFDVYKQISKQIHSIFKTFTHQIEPLSLDEAYLDVTNCQLLQGSATHIAQEIKAEIRKHTGLVASAGVSYNKFLAKVASDYDKPDGFYRILPHEGEAFIAALPIGDFFGVGAVTEAKMMSLGINSGADLRRWSLSDLQHHFGSRANYYYLLARGIDERPVSATRTRKSIGSETTFDQDIDEPERMLEVLQELAQEVIDEIRRSKLLGSTVTVKVRFDDFQIVTRSMTLPESLNTFDDVCALLPMLLDRAIEGPRKVRLLGVSISGLISEDNPSPRQLKLF